MTHSPDTYSADCVVIGAGIVGLAVARRLALSGRDVLVLEREGAPGLHASGRNSEVVHAGIYYPEGSLKARLCVAGRHALESYCESRGVALKRCGKLIVACDVAQLPALARLHDQGVRNGVEGLALLDAGEARALEPALACAGALYSPATGIVDSHALMLAYRGEAEDRGAAIAFHTPVARIEVCGGGASGGLRVETGGAAPARIDARAVINCAGLFAPALAAATEGLDPAHVPAGYLCKGSYFALSGQAPFSRLIYPVPEAAGLGVHLTLDMGGQARFGPDTQWVETLDYDVDPARAPAFAAAVRRYWPDLPEGALVPAYAGIRPKIAGPDAPAADFRIDGPREHAIVGLINLFGIESPGLTASLAIAEEVAARLDAGG